MPQKLRSHVLLKHVAHVARDATKHAFSIAFEYNCAQVKKINLPSTRTEACSLKNPQIQAMVSAHQGDRFRPSI